MNFYFYGMKFQNIMTVSRKNYLIALLFAFLHALCCITCRVLNAQDSFVLTLLTITMVFLLCQNRKIKVLQMFAYTIVLVVAAYILGNAFPKLLVHITGDTLWTNSISTFLTTLILGSGFEFAMSKTAKPEYRPRWIVHLNGKILPVHTDDIAYFVSEDKCNYLVKKDGTKYIVDANMDSIAGDLNPAAFFRINRGCIVSLDSIVAVNKDSGRYLLELKPAYRLPLTIPRSRVDAFMTWLA